MRMDGKRIDIHINILVSMQVNILFYIEDVLGNMQKSYLEKENK